MLKKLIGLGILVFTLCGCYTDASIENEDSEYLNGSIYYNGGFYDYNMGFIWLPQFTYYYNRDLIVTHPRRHVIHPRYIVPPRVHQYQAPVLPSEKYKAPPVRHQNPPSIIHRNERFVPPSNQGRTSQDNRHINSRPNNSSRSEGRRK